MSGSGVATPRRLTVSDALAAVEARTGADPAPAAQLVVGLFAVTLSAAVFVSLPLTLPGAHVDWMTVAVLAAAALLSSALPVPGTRTDVPSSGITVGVLLGVIATQPWAVAVLLAAAVPTRQVWAIPRHGGWQLWVRTTGALAVAISWQVSRLFEPTLFGYAGRIVSGIVVGALVHALCGVVLCTISPGGCDAGSAATMPPLRDHLVHGAWTLAAAAAVVGGVAYASFYQQLVVVAGGALTASVWAVVTASRLTVREQHLRRQAETNSEAASHLLELYRVAAQERQSSDDELAAALHDRVLQTLSASRTMMHLSPQHAQAAFEEALSAMREVIDGLRSPVVDTLGLRAAVEQQAARLAAATGLNVDVAVAQVLADYRGPGAQRILKSCRAVLDTASRRADAGDEISLEVVPLGWLMEHDDAASRSPLPGPHTAVRLRLEGTGPPPDADALTRLGGQADGTLTLDSFDGGWELLAEVADGLHESPSDGATPRPALPAGTACDPGVAR